MAKITFEQNQNNDLITLDVEPGTSILEAAREAGIALESPCNGAGVCGKCRLYKTQIEPVSALLIKKCVYTDKNGDEGYVLACQACITDDIRIALEQKEEKDLKIVSDGRSFKLEIDSDIRKEYDPDDNRTQVYLGDEKIAVEEGNTEDLRYGVVIDIGTTTLVAALYDLVTGEELSSESALNPQALHAQDVLSRIKMASEPEGLKLLYNGVTEKINELTEVICRKVNVDPTYVYEIVYSGNTCMIHLATNVNPESMGKYPYTPVIRGGNFIRASDNGTKIAPEGRIYLPPIISSYVGPDITSGILASQIEKLPGITLFVDIGTNGEMAIGRNGELAVTSTAAGPAFEGMNIEHGMRAAEGAIEFFEISEDGRITMKTIGDKAPVGICGSGLLDIVGELVSCGAIGSNGKFAKPEKQPLPESVASRLVKMDGKTVFRLSDKVVLTQKDVRQVQLAKGAVRSGIEYLLKSLSIEAGEADRVLIAGSFGYHLRSKSLLSIGLLPAEFEGKIEYIGNTSKTGGQAFLLNPGYRSEMKDLVQKIKVEELANDENFEKIFVKALGF